MSSSSKARYPGKIILSILFVASNAPQVLATVYEDWEQTGEYSISGVALKQLEEMNPVIQFLANAVADELLERRQRMADQKRKERGENGI